MPKSRSTPEPKTASTRDRLIDAAFVVVARDGLEAASVKAIAAEAGIAPGLLHYHFKTKDELLEAALRRGLDEYRAAIAARRGETPAEGQIDALFEDARAAVDGYADYFRLRLAFAARALSSPELARVMLEVNAGAAEEMARSIAAAAGRDDPSASDHELAMTLKAAFEGVMLARLLNPDFPMDSADAILRAGARQWIEELALTTRP